MTRHLFVVDPLERIHIDQDSSFALMEECQGRGHEVYTCDTDKLGARGSDAWADARPTTVRRVIGDHVTLGEPGRRPLGDFDVVLPVNQPRNLGCELFGARLEPVGCIAPVVQLGFGRHRAAVADVLGRSGRRRVVLACRRIDVRIDLVHVVATGIVPFGGRRGRRRRHDPR